jgi:RimJ/RimL family protein N-acetyltransferase
MMNLSFNPLDLPNEKQILADWLSNETWPFHVNTHLAKAKALEMIEQGYFSGTDHQTFWIISSTENRIGMIRLFDLDDIDDGYPMFDLRILNKFRGKGIGQSAVRWLTRYIFETWPALDRIAGTTRADNLSMRRVFKKCGYAKEGHYRKDWAAQNGEFRDTVRYGILREDWEGNKITPVNWQDEDSK